jgi:predicted AAA+ superfamily ATPase
MYPLTINELGKDFELQKALRFGTLPAVYSESNPEEYLQSYLGTYLEQEINQEGMTRNLSAFYRFLQVASFSQGSPLNTSSIAREVGINNKVVDNYFTILSDLLIGSFLPAFTRRAKRRLVERPKFYLFDSGIYNTARPKGYLDKSNEIDGISLETLFLNHLKAINEYYRLEYTFSYYRTASGLEVDFIAYGPNGFHAFEIKSGNNLSSRYLRGLKAFSKDYPEAKLHLFYLGNQKMYEDNITIHPFREDIISLLSILSLPTVPI